MDLLIGFAGRKFIVRKVGFVKAIVLLTGKYMVVIPAVSEKQVYFFSVFI
jgi:hypothetical protein